MKLLAIFLALFLSAPGLCFANTQGDPESLTNPQPGTPQARMLERLKQLVDKDKDGVLSEEETKDLKMRIKQRAELVRKDQDLNSDGQVDAKEREAFVARIGEFRTKLIQMFDADKDGNLNEKEKLNAQEWLSTQKKLPLP